MRVVTSLPEIKFIQAKYYHKGRLKPIQLIVLHSMESPETNTIAENIAAGWQRSDSRVASCHYCVDNDSIVQCVRLEDTAFQCMNANANGIGVEHAGKAFQTRGQWLDTYGLLMLDLSARLVANLCKQFDIPPRMAEFRSATDPTVITTGITLHSVVPKHGTHTDPGPGFPLQWYLLQVQNIFNLL